MNEWQTLLRNVLRDEHGSRPSVGILATVDATGAPCARSLVCRRIDESGIVMVSDRRSEKNRQLRQDPRAELVFWLAKARIQFRIAGEISLGVDTAIWRSLSDASRSLFFWPAPASTIDRSESSFPSAVSTDAAPPESFEVLTLRPVRVERLDLNPHPHHRRRWELARSPDEWVGIDINP